MSAAAQTGDPRTIVIAPSRGWRRLDLGELWRYRELLYFFVWRDLKVRYKQTAFGALWAIIQPLLLMVVFSLFLGRISGIAPEGAPYPLFAFAALVPWTLFAQSVVGSSASLVEATNLLQKVYFPRLLLPAAATGSYLVDLAIALGVLAVLMIWFGAIPGVTALWLLPLTCLALAAALGVGVWLSAINVRYRDVRYAVPFLVQLWLFASPVAYSSDLVPPALRAVYELNPMVGVIDGFRWSLLGVGELPLRSLAVGVTVTTLVLATGIAYFRRVERTFADVI
jgi:lipopolysaccharide transport system permease protein